MKKKPKSAWALVDKREGLIRMDPDSGALAIFDSRESARRAQRANSGTVIKPVMLARPK